MLKIKHLNEMYDMKVFTDQGEYFGDIEESILSTNKISAWRIKATKNSFLSKVLGGAKGVIVPHQLVRAIVVRVIIKSKIICSLNLLRCK